MNRVTTNLLIPDESGHDGRKVSERPAAPSSGVSASENELDPRCNGPIRHNPTLIGAGQGIAGFQGEIVDTLFSG
jgi:hypothetical protein